MKALGDLYVELRAVLAKEDFYANSRDLSDIFGLKVASLSSLMSFWAF